jgi:hypothetical protein
MLRRSGDPRRAWAAARKAYHRDRHCDADDPYVRQVFGDVDPVEPGYDPFDGAVREYPSFEELAVRVWGPLFEHRREVAGEENDLDAGEP